MDWCCLAGLLAGGVPPGRIRIWGILISLHLFPFLGRILLGGDGFSLSGGHFAAGDFLDSVDIFIMNYD